MDQLYPEPDAETAPVQAKTTHHHVEPSGSQTSYLLNSQGRIVEVSCSWDKSAWTHNAFGATADYVIGQQLSDFVEGFATASFLNALMFASRRGYVPFQMLVRSDSDTQLRVLRMQITPAPNDLLKVSHEVLLERCFKKLGVDDQLLPPVFGCRCSMCCNHRLGDAWVNPLADRKRRYVASSYEICPDCKTRARHALVRVQGPANVMPGLHEDQAPYTATA